MRAADQGVFIRRIVIKGDVGELAAFLPALGAVVEGGRLGRGLDRERAGRVFGQIADRVIELA